VAENGIVALQGALMDLLIELKRVCEKNGIEYFVTGGTLLGAVRHKGFIPWDDDMDIGMARRDYERFREVCRTDLDGAYQFYDWHTDTASPLPFGKLKIRGTRLVEDISSDSGANQEVFIDIFPYDAAPDGKLARRRHAYKTVLYRKLLMMRSGFHLSDQRRGIRRVVNKTLYAILRLLYSPVKTETLRARYDRVARRYNGKETSHLVNLCGAYSYKREMKDKSLLFPFVTLPFAGETVLAPCGYDRFLREVYGDYMQLPPPDQQKPRHNITFDLGAYRIRHAGSPAVKGKG